MKKTSIVAAVTAGIMVLTTGTAAFARETRPASGTVVKANESDLTVMPGAGSDPLHLRFSGAGHLYANLPGELTVFRATGGTLHYRPVAYQMIDGKMKYVDLRFTIEGNDQASVRFGERDDKAPIVVKWGAVITHQPVLW